MREIANLIKMIMQSKRINLSFLENLKNLVVKFKKSIDFYIKCCYNVRVIK